MNFELTIDEGEYLVKLARKAIENFISKEETIEPSDVTEKFRKHCGVFVTLNKISGKSHKLRGCIGFPYPVKPLVEATTDAAISAALRDPRFNPVYYDEMSSILVEVSVLTPPEPIHVEKRESLPGLIKIGQDGLIINSKTKKGLLLPQVPIDWGWDAEEFLTQTCLKAWLPPDAWLLPDTEVSKFTAIIFGEETPRGKIKRVEL